IAIASSDGSTPRRTSATHHNAASPGAALESTARNFHSLRSARRDTRSSCRKIADCVVAPGRISPSLEVNSKPQPGQCTADVTPPERQVEARAQMGRAQDPSKAGGSHRIAELVADEDIRCERAGLPHAELGAEERLNLNRNASDRLSPIA